MVLVFRHLTSKRRVSGSYPGRDTNCPRRIFVVILSHSRKIPRFYLTLNPWLLHATSFSVRYFPNHMVYHTIDSRGKAELMLSMSLRRMVEVRYISTHF